MANYKLIHFDKISSTQTYAHELIANGTATDGTVIVADSQISGYGRYGRKWISNTGNLYVSFIYKMENRNPKLSYAVAVAVAEALIHFGVKPKIKWPNDILIDGKKNSGILIEYSGDFVIIGIGVNIKSNPKLSEYETAKLIDYTDVDKDKFLSILMKKLEIWLYADFTIIRSKWTELATGLNEFVKYRGTVAQLIGINEDGALVLRIGSEYVTKYGDEISF